MIELIQHRLNSYQATNPVQEAQATREIIQRKMPVRRMYSQKKAPVCGASKPT